MSSNSQPGSDHDDELIEESKQEQEQEQEQVEQQHAEEQSQETPADENESSSPPHQQQEETKTENEVIQQQEEVVPEETENNDNENDDDDDDGDRVYAETLRKALELQEEMEEKKNISSSKTNQQQQQQNQPSSTTSSPKKKQSIVSFPQEEEQNEEDEQQQQLPQEDLHVQLEENQSICNNKFTTIARLGAGESSTVWLAESSSSKKHYALKMFKNDPMIQDSFDYERRVNEFAVKQLSLPQNQEKIRSIIISASSSSNNSDNNNNNSRSSPPTSPFKKQQETSSSTRDFTSPPVKSPLSSSSSSSFLLSSSPTTTTKREIEYLSPKNHLPFAAKDALFKIQIQCKPKATVRPCREPSFFSVNNTEHHHRTYPVLKRASSSSASSSFSHNHNNSRKGSSSVTSPHHKKNKNQQRNEEPPSPVHWNASSTASQSSSPQTSPRGGGNNNNNSISSARGPPSLLSSSSSNNNNGKKAQDFMGLAPLVGRSCHRPSATAESTSDNNTNYYDYDMNNNSNKKHLVLVFNALGPSVEWMMSTFSYKGVPLPVVIQILKNTALALAQLELVHLVHSDIKPENILFKEREYPKLEAVAKKSIAGHGAPLSLFQVVIIDFGLSFLLPMSQRQINKNNTTTNTLASSSTSSNKPTPMIMISPTKNSTSLSAEELVLLKMSNYKRGVTIQTREYRAPEAIFGSHFSHPTDVFSLGCTAFELVTGNFLFDPKRYIDKEELRNTFLNNEEEGGEGKFEILCERMMDLVHLFDMQRVCACSSIKEFDSYLSKFGEGGSGIHAHRYIEQSAKNRGGARLKLTCECARQEEEEKKAFFMMKERRRRNNNESDEDDEEEYQDEEAEERKQVLENQINANDAIFHFCIKCQRIAHIPSEFTQNAVRDLHQESMHKFGVGDEEGVDCFVSFVTSCIRWEPSRRAKPVELLSHPFLTSWAKKVE